MTPIHVAIVEDDAMLRKFMEEAVCGCADFRLAGSFSSAEEFREHYRRLAGLRVVIMDINLPGISGIRCIEEMKPKDPEVQYLVCTVFEDSIHLFNALCAGATGYVLKSAGEEELVRSVREIHAGGSPMSPQIARMVVTSFPQKRADHEAVSGLSKRELELLELLSAGYRYKDIAERLFLSIETVRSYIRDIYSKLQVHSRTEAVNKVYNSQGS
jgi:DNA-binding NarL/FixJ family response regulator